MIGWLETERLLLRPLGPTDLDLLVALNSDAEVMRFITGRPSSVDEVSAELTDSLGTRWLEFDRSTGDFLGWISAIAHESGNEYEVGWRLLRAAWGQGIASEGARALIGALFAGGAARVFAQTMSVNTRSRRVMKRVGLRYIRTFHVQFDDPLPGTELGEVEYGLTREQWGERR